MSFSDQLGFTFQPPQRRIWSVRELVSAARTALERAYTDVYVEGEISNYRPADSGHIYCTLKDGEAQLSIVMFRTQARLLRFKPENGLQVIARGRLTVYEARGSLQLQAEYLEPKGAGALLVAFEQLKSKLAAEGLFDASRKKALPAMPKRIGIVTSPRGAALQDMLNVLRRRHEGLHLIIFPAQVQGESAAREVAVGLQHFNAAKRDPVDVIVIARGGGSAEDLAAFNDEALARAIAASRIPTISAIGHETDFTIADFVADLRAPTPSAAAELVIATKRELNLAVATLHRRLERAARYRLMMLRQSLGELARHGAFAEFRRLLHRRQVRLDDLAFRLFSRQKEVLQQRRRRWEVATSRLGSLNLARTLVAQRREVHKLQRGLQAAISYRLREKRERIERQSQRLTALSPLGILERGYALAYDAGGALVKDSAALQPQEKLRLRFARGEADVRVEKKRDT